ncbi:cellulase family glycosylhydrolase [Streptomyces sp. 3MP-14]|uniref:Cellulase family glycosylhydrolase n=1 Tax=Streptomyces mimosae TaxID=2586635 RepID=A0A5N6A7S8_9ACTN|nr:MULTISPECIES: cellulase family glycosylhydrolase [Streptomyces]KAB8163770.1 cellulase family glycosylhydrolase [Streptomyces mimosae]KAB8175213.1 cellulase family glycosylhydrolase [Streptomyces sp. 3MP-14]
MRLRSPRTLRRRTTLAAAGVLGMLLAVLGMATPAHAATGIHVSNGRILEANGNDLVMRGVNHAHTWYAGQLGALGDIKRTGANTVRVVLSSGDRWTRNDASDVANVIGQCKANRLICVLEVHDTTGYGDDGAAITLDRAVDYWISVKGALDGQENYVILNIGNEPFGNNNADQWTWSTSNAIQRLRNAGFDHAIMADAPGWGQDGGQVMRNNAAQVFNADPDRNTIFSVHMYGVYDTAGEIQSYLGSFVNAGLPIVVGEFGHYHSDGDPDEDTILATAQSWGLGWLAWSWSGNGGGVEYLDLVNGFNADSPTWWGERVIRGTNGIAATSREATVYSQGAGTAPNGYPYCLHGGNTDPDGDGWGWENNQSCVVRGGPTDW